MSELKKFEQILDNPHVNYFTRETLNALKGEYEKALGEITELQTKLAESEARVADFQASLSDMAWVFESLLNNMDGGEEYEVYLRAKDKLRQQQTNGE